MLKLEKIAKTLEISIILRTRTPLLTQSFKYAFFIALTLHLFAGALFTIQLMNLSESLTIFPPTYVESEFISSLNNQARAEYDKEEGFSRYFGEPPESKPELPKLAGQHFEPPKVTFQKPQSHGKNPFLKLESWLLNPVIPFSQTCKLSQRPIKIKISGELEDYPVIRKGWDSADVSFLKKIKADKLAFSYNIRVDLQTGEIFWYEPLFNKSLKASKVAEKILTNIQFDISDSIKAVASGILEISFFTSEEIHD